MFATLVWGEFVVGVRDACVRITIEDVGLLECFEVPQAKRGVPELLLVSVFHQVDEEVDVEAADEVDVKKESDGDDNEHNKDNGHFVAPIIKAIGAFNLTDFLTDSLLAF